MKKGTLYIISCYIIWGLLPIFWKLLGNLNSMYILSSRIVWSLVFCVILLVISKNFEKIKATFKDKKEFKLLFVAGILITLNWGSYIWAVNNNHILDASLAYYMNPIMAILIGTLLFKERLTKLQWVSVFVVITGVIVSVIMSGTFPYISVIIGIPFAIYGGIKKSVKADSETSLFVETLVVTPIALAFILFSEFTGTGSLNALHGLEFLLLPLAGVITAIPLLLFSKGVKDIPYTLTGIIMYINPTIQLILSVLLFKEPFTKMNIVLFSFVWIGIIIFVTSNLIEYRKSINNEA